MPTRQSIYPWEVCRAKLNFTPIRQYLRKIKVGGPRVVANGHCCHLKHLKSALSKAAFPGKAGLYWGLYSVLALVWTNTLNKRSGLEQHSQPIREWELQVITGTIFQLNFIQKIAQFISHSVHRETTQY